jgi:hypothetical protein
MTTGDLQCLTTLDRAIAALKGNSPALATTLLDQFRDELVQEIELIRTTSFTNGLDAAVQSRKHIEQAARDARDPADEQP